MNTSTPNFQSSEIRRFGFWGRLSLPFKLMAAFGVVFVIALAIAGGNLLSLNQVESSYEHALSQGKELQRISDALLIYELQARRAEKNFLQRWTSEGFDAAYEAYITRTPADTTLIESGARGPTFLMSVTEMRARIDELAPFGDIAATVASGDMTKEQYEANLTSLLQYTEAYEINLLAIVEAMRQRGDNEEAGMQSVIRDAAHSIEAKTIDKEGLENLVITYLQIRRREKDYLARQDQIYVDNVHSLVAQFKTQASAAESLTPTEQAELKGLIGQYQLAFDILVAKDAEINALNENMIAAARAMEPILKDLESLGERLAVDDVALAQEQSARAITVSAIIALMALALTIFLSIILARQITRPVISLTRTAEIIASGNFDAQAEVSSADEVGALASTFNAMTSRLRSAFEDVRRRALAVQTSAEVSRRLTVANNPRQLALDVVEQVQAAFNYYHAHIYFVDEVTGDLLMAGGTGEAGATMLARGHKVSKGRGLVGRAAETNAPVLVPDVSKAEGWLPNPLLPETRAEAAVPIAIGKQVLGVLDVQQNATNGLGEEDVELLKALASQTAISLQNVRSYEESRAQAELEAKINLIGQKIQRAATVEETLQTAIRELGTAIGAPRVKAQIARPNDGNASNH